MKDFILNCWEGVEGGAMPQDMAFLTQATAKRGESESTLWSHRK